MTEQEPILKPIPFDKYLLSALPALGATVVVLIHLRAPLVPGQHQSILMNGWLGVLCATLTYWLYLALCRVADRICARFDAWHGNLAETTETHAEASSRDFRTAMVKLGKICKRLETIERQNKEMTEELAHLRELLVETDPSSLTGPSPYS